MPTSLRVPCFALLSLLAVACGDDDDRPAADASPDGMGGDAMGADGGDGDASMTTMVCDEPAEVPCVDQSIQELSLYDTVNPDPITEEGEGPPVFSTHIDSEAGGLSPSEAYIYARFTETGLEKVEITDEDALESMDWDVAFRRFVIRFNSGVSGPSCVTVARTAPMTEFDELDSVPSGLMYRTEEYFTGDSCDLVTDGSGLPGSPGTAMSSYWSYMACVQMTGNVYVVELQSGRHVKLQVLSYYEPEPQMVCNETGAVPSPSGAGNLRIKWAFLD